MKYAAVFTSVELIVFALIQNQHFGETQLVDGVPADGSSCHCHCTVKSPSSHICKKVRSQQGQMEPLYLVSALSSGPNCHCSCKMDNTTSWNPCEIDWAQEKIRNKALDLIKVFSMAEQLTEAMQSNELRRLNANVNRLSLHLKTLEQELKYNVTLRSSSIEESQVNLMHHAQTFKNYSETIRTLAKQLSKLNLFLRHKGFNTSVKPAKTKSPKHPEFIDQGVRDGKETKKDGKKTLAIGNFGNNVGVKERSSAGSSSNKESEKPDRASSIPVTDLEDGQTNNGSPTQIRPAISEEQSSSEHSNRVREDDCAGTLTAVEEPFTHGKYGKAEGAWMKDPLSGDDNIYVANYLFGSTLLEFRNLEYFKQGRVSRSYGLPCSWIGTGHVVYNGSFYYNKAFTQTILRYDLHQRSTAAWNTLDDLIPQPATPSRWRGYSDVNFAADESGLWVVYASNDFGYQPEDVLVVAKIDPVELVTRKETTWKTGLRRQFYGNYFIICGVLYVVNQQAQKDGSISFAYDTHTNSDTSPGLLFPSHSTILTQLDYNPKDKLLYAWDNGTQVTYSLLFIF
ncbi:olfactomedin-like protein 2A [Protopterus annectens]|uniref:olfactomedin-like protein 2A n=1 Tax=Protopterus annectens TaxID=7888 RepID=UPI001CF9B593|nr:olfactomedin-like protein 2A [Protopterus annectens]